MYSRRLCDVRESALLADPGFRTIFPTGIPRYSLADSAQFTAQLIAAVDPTTLQPLRAFTADEQEFLRATRLRTTFDFEYFAERFVWIDEEAHGLRRLYPLWESQTFALDALGRLEWDRYQSNHPDGLLVNILKARQLGISTLFEALSAHRLLTRTYTRALTGADVEEQAGYLFRMIGRLFDELPWFLKPDRLTFVKNREMSFSNHSYLKVAWGQSTRGALQAISGQEGSKGAIGRGQTYSVVHISELATWANPEQLDTALFPTIPISPYSLVGLESTAEFAGDWWHQQWLVTGEGEGRFANIFIPWGVEPGKYSLPAPVDWTPTTQTLEHAKKAEASLLLWLGRTISLTRDQLYWYERSRRVAEKKGQLHKFLKEYPADDKECFQYAGRSVFTFEQLDAIDAAGSRRRLQDVWAVEPSREIAELRRLPESQDDAAAGDRAREQAAALRRPNPPLSLRIPTPTSALAPDTYPVPPGYGFRRLTPAQLKDLPSLRHSVLAIWEYPRARGRRRYIISADISDGLGLDYAVADVIRLPTIEEPAEQVAQFVTNRLDAKQMAFVIDAIGRFYQDEDAIEAMAAIETNNHGLSTQDTLQLHLGYGHFYTWEYADAASPEKRFSTKIGWVTSPRTRPLLLSAFHDAIVTVDPVTSQPDFILNSAITRGELRHFITQTTLAEAEAARGQHDDGIMAAAIGYYVSWRMAGGETEPIAEKRRRRAAQQAQSLTAGQRHGRDYRNSDVTTEEADQHQEDGDEFADDLSEGSSLHFDPRNRIDGI